jgi:hypothetical protein
VIVTFDSNEALPPAAYFQVSLTLSGPTTVVTVQLGGPVGAFKTVVDPATGARVVAVTMLCGKCQDDNLPDAAFCSECGAKLEAVCPSCELGNYLARSSAAIVAQGSRQQERVLPAWPNMTNLTQRRRANADNLPSRSAI